MEATVEGMETTGMAKPKASRPKPRRKASPGKPLITRHKSPSPPKRRKK